MPGRHPLSRPAPTPERREALAAFFEAHHRHLTLRLCAWTVAISVWDIDDACSFAWLQLTGRPDITLDRRGFAWLTTVALREARRLAKAPELEPRPDRSSIPSDPHERALTPHRLPRARPPLCPAQVA